MLERLLQLLGRDSGPRVRLLGRGLVVYTEGDHRMQIEAEMLTGPEDWVVYTDSIRRWDPPFQDEEVTPEVKQRIIDAILAQFRRWRQVVELAERPEIEPWARGTTIRLSEEEDR